MLFFPGHTTHNAPVNDWQTKFFCQILIYAP